MATKMANSSPAHQVLSNVVKKFQCPPGLPTPFSLLLLDGTPGTPSCLSPLPVSPQLGRTPFLEAPSRRTVKML